MTHTQTFDLGTTRSDLETYLVQCGYWGNEELRRRHAYVLSPSVYQLSPLQELDLNRLARVTYAAVRKLQDELIELTTGGRLLSHADALFLKLASLGSRSLLTPKDAKEGKARIPPVIKIDLIQNREGKFFIAEVDVYNPRGFGYAAMLEESLHPSLQYFRYPGVAGLMESFSTSSEDPLDWYIVVSEFERYYDTAYRMLAHAFKKRDMRLRLVHEGRVCGYDGLPEKRCGILAIPESMHQHPHERVKLLERYHDETVHTLYPPFVYLGSKAFLPYLRQYDGMAEFLPPTSLVRKHGEHRMDGVPMVLKAAVSSGMKGVYFSDLDGEEFMTVLQRVERMKRPSWILQEQVPQTPLPVVVFNEDGSRVEKHYFVRVTAYIAESGVIDVEITGRPDRKVHGAPDCIQLPVILTRDMW